MKPILIAMLILSSSFYANAQSASIGAFEKLRQMYTTGFAPDSTEDVQDMLAKVKGCAQSYETAPNLIYKKNRLVHAFHTSDSFGPDFPSETLNGIAMTSMSDTELEVSASFFSSYSENLTNVGLELATKYFYEEHECPDSYDGNYVPRCFSKTYSKNYSVTIRVNNNYILYSNPAEGEFGYCWK